MIERMARRRPRGVRSLLLAGVALFGAATTATAQTSTQTPPPSAPELIVTYVEPPVAKADEVRRDLLAYATQTARAPGHPAAEVLREIGRPNRLAVIERWPAGATPGDGLLAASYQSIQGKLEAPIDRRVNREIGSLLGAKSQAPFHMLMHVDVAPAGAEMAAKLLEEQRASILAAGALGFEVGVQADKSNHFAVHEIWPSRATYEAYAASPPAQDLRRQLAAVKGALFDDRFFVSATTGSK